jgi:hypothetical protein
MMAVRVANTSTDPHKFNVLGTLQTTTEGHMHLITSLDQGTQARTTSSPDLKLKPSVIHRPGIRPTKMIIQRAPSTLIRRRIQVVTTSHRSHHVGSVMRTTYQATMTDQTHAYREVARQSNTLLREALVAQTTICLARRSRIANIRKRLVGITDMTLHSTVTQTHGRTMNFKKRMKPQPTTVR